MKTKLFITALALMAVTTIASAQGPGNGQGLQNGKGNGTAYVDENKNGVCDNYENGTPQQAVRKRDGSGNGQGCHRCNGRRGNGRGTGRNFIDKNNNGVCDNRETPSTGK